MALLCLKESIKQGKTMGLKLTTINLANKKSTVPIWEDLSISRFKRNQASYEYLVDNDKELEKLEAKHPKLQDRASLRIKLSNLEKSYNKYTYYKYSMLISSFFDLKEAIEALEVAKEILRDRYLQREAQTTHKNQQRIDLKIILQAREYIEGKLANYIKQYSIIIQGFRPVGIEIEEELALLKLAGGESEDFKPYKNSNR